MESGNLKVVKDLRTRQSRAPAAAEVGLVKADEKNIPGPIPVRLALHLDVDAVLRRSLPTWPKQHS
jgi:hypothetical protein